jgi:hypothetical protein
MKIRTILIVLGCALVAAGCSNVTTRIAPNANLAQHKRIYVEHRLADGRDLDGLIAQDLRARGYDASSGPMTLMPRDTELVVSYADQWAWDFNWYMNTLDIAVRAARTDKGLATVHCNRPSAAFGSPPTVMIHDVLSKLF